ncbi:MAG: OmpH family outer membrane protein [Odoribacteraceae bacterium]|jgi:outer membrane protein|nr:OmpH family outer membrane protein [Odoribacteraceae bacterium]
MKNVSLGVNVLLSIAVIVLYVLHFEGGKKPKNDNESTRTTATGESRIVYLNMDTLLTKYNQSRELNEAYLKKVEAARADLNYKVKMWAQDGEAFEKKMNNNGYLSRERADQDYKELMIRKENLEKLEQEVRETSYQQQMELNQKLYNTIVTFLAEYNREKGHDMILSTTLGGNVFYAEPGLDITREVVDQLNARYAGK